MSDDVVHVVVLPSAGMGHLTPFLRLSALLLHQHCKVTLIIPQPTVTLSESQLLSRFHSTFPQVNQLHFQLPPPTSNEGDPLFQRVEAIRASGPILSTLLSSISSPPLSVVVSDIFMISTLVPITHTLSLPNYVLFTSSATMFAFFSHCSTLSASSDAVEIPGISPIPRSSIPPVFLVPDSKSVLRNIFMEDSPKVTKLHGFLINTFEALEQQALEALNAGKVVSEMPPVFSVGPFAPCEFEKEGQWGNGKPLRWLDDQDSGSVVYVSFGSRTALGRDQIREIGEGLMRSGCRFLWVVKDKIVDREEEEGKLEDVLGVELVERMREKGMVMKEWVYQSGILGHRAVGGFVSHCGWNSVMEAAWNGVPILGWPQHGDQKLNAEVVERSGWGIWNKNWGWIGERIVKAEEIGKAINAMMNNESLKVKAAQVKEVGRKATSVDGDCEVTLHKIIEEWKNVENKGR
ncbi:hypothetical protein RIF29_26362 [Crotalaria pallida]|uniref:Glycosyltransferase n=1 Tax=Crotalaria pallida TaxID=3830 RepID=A0AAN9EQ11_CROPI